MIEDIPVQVGTMNRKQGIKGFEPADVGHPVFEFRDRYIIYLTSEFYQVNKQPDGSSVREKIQVAVPYYKEMLAPLIDFL